MLALLSLCFQINNLKKILQMVLDYYNEVGACVWRVYGVSPSQARFKVILVSVGLQVLTQDISGFPLPDLALVAERSDPVELGRLLQLVLGCAVNCERKQGVCAG